MKNLRITVRIEEPVRRRIEKRIHQDRFKSISSLMRVALLEFLEREPTDDNWKRPSDQDMPNEPKNMPRRKMCSMDQNLETLPIPRNTL